MNQIKIGKLCDNGKPIYVDIQKLIETRILKQANSGGGKSFLIRKFIEECYGKVQQIVLDLEGEFFTLRDKYDFLLVGDKKGGADIPINIRTAELMARKVLELNANVIFDMSEMKKHERTLFVKRFVNALVECPKNLRHPVIIYVDEAHQFCPERQNSESTASIIDLMTRGRKRGQCGDLATQRLSKLNKDAAAETNNVLIGRTTLDIDLKRAGEILGLTSRSEIQSLRFLKPGEFYAFGPAFSERGVFKVKIGNVKTKHLRPGEIQKLSLSNSPTKKVKKILQKLSDLPKEAEEELRSINDYKRKVNDLRIELRKKNMEMSNSNKNTLDSKEFKNMQKSIGKELILKDKKIKELGCRNEKAVSTINELRGMFIIARDEHIHLFQFINEHTKLISSGLTVTQKEFNKMEFNFKKIDSVVKYLTSPMKTKDKLMILDTISPKNPPKINIQEKKESQGYSKEISHITGGAKRMLKAIVKFKRIGLTIKQVAGISKLKSTSGTFSTYKGKLNSSGLIYMENRRFYPTEEGIDLAGSVEEMPERGHELITFWKNQLTGGAKKMFSILVEHYPGGMDRENLAMNADLTATSGTFSTYLGKIKGFGLAVQHESEIKANPDLFD